jgi:predicted aspartyl protease
LWYMSFQKIHVPSYRAGRMTVSLEFAASHHYGGSTDGIDVPITLSVRGQSVDLLAKVDTGAAHCIFERRYAEFLGLDVESGRLQRFRTVAGSFSAYEHEVNLQALGIEIVAMVFFAQDQAFSRNFVGRSGWLDRLRLGIIV